MSDAITRLNAALQDRYAIEREIGEGGMAIVYLAQDLKHNRPVALKVLKPELSALVGAERFLAEIETTANLQHPHILPLFDSGEADGFLFYVMPYFEGETLKQRIDREKQLPVDECVRLAKAVASALDYAHRRGVIHRDIKPANILLQDGEPVVADFGIAIAVGAGGGSRLTETGLSVGTPFYMSPEQATGDQQVGPPSDTYALACVLYEMLVGEPPYLGNTAQAVLGRIIQGVPVSATAIRKSVPANVDAAIRKALEKLPSDRFTSAQDFGKALADPGFRHGESGATDSVVDVGRWKRVAAALAALLVVGSGFGVWSVVSVEPTPPMPVERFASPFRADQMPQAGGGVTSFALSRDGTMLVYAARGDGGTALFTRRWDDLDAAPVPQTVGGAAPAFSPDGQELAFAQGTDIQVVPLLGGPPRTLTSSASPLQVLHWADDGYVYFSLVSGSARVPAAGGPVDTLTSLSEGEVFHAVSEVFPSMGMALLSVARSVTDVEMRVLDLSTGETTILGPGRLPRYTSTGHLVYVLPTGEGRFTLMAAPFDADAFELTGPPTAMVEGAIQFTISESGKLFYVSAAGSALDWEFVWVTRSGQATAVDPGLTFQETPGTFGGWSLSPDGRRLALADFRDGNGDIWIKELDDGPLSRLTFGELQDVRPSWSPDGRDVTFNSLLPSGSFAPFTKPADGTGAAERLLELDENILRAFWSPDGEWLVLRTAAANAVAGVAGERDVLAMRPGVDSVPLRLLAEEYDEVGPALSPDGRWLAYNSDETGTYEVFVRPFPDVAAGKWQISTAGGVSPVWAHSGRELFFMNGDSEIVAAQIETGAGFQVRDRITLFQVPSGYLQPSFIQGHLDVALDDQRFLMARSYTGGGEASVEWVLVVNWFEELKRRVGN